ncbi:cytosolic Fe-S cluster assembly factor NAR1 [Cryptococcus neoformans C23]|uniref:Cytosolic Fe-S cluster assembly factor NAR1 n=1 Tax=Cryptococcus neoformans (strain H99 / ATCC 208821 / CBS 10515 / FGSC 9487) TaxID=235443 RepID=J9VWH2_CRYN9|nr:cytosolic Fe-S cluster assembly factor NAR1 [Cryptococcus neoformans var. grubii H99]AFR96934.1 cytosolic Fe-S cluster assembly factor NAR1 [Cryptococcus neoformans var. grubii H99]AUB26902.1 cytosolic Fe-S cluster assembly factor NAR1 [Cryptococcus neoformans var. grubii]OWZ29240.1 cytosolic Fe-S cluster assembly factor NAR1 [Cryptococcus neoformans var. grubii AD2-60a]OWZ41106.1 cytosolic Fe-S cluster assembly factor NAR1 [Cryptococcus neoformans var. grubii C23]|eukprot:XP_012051658.1 cytosolic Fe-S cluster assembly factor NAR1 [Cryptococcus neoformans var. grubii H99]
MAFSGALTITDLDDFLTPSQACIIPVRNNKKPAQDEGPTEIHIDSNNNYYEVSTYPSVGHDDGIENSKKALEKAEINLNDCLACSGCITSTESLLITMQSQNEILQFIKTNPTTTDPDSPCHKPRLPILSISPQTLASLSAAYATASSRHPIPLLVLLRRIRTFLSQPENGSWRVWDTTFARHMSLRESVMEFHERKDEKEKGKAAEMPMLASACPGWVCYAEKAQGDMLPLLSAARSSQGIIGALAKSWYGPKLQYKPDEIYHVTAMPCYDKKLEASRSDFYSSLYSTRDVDCVLTTGELDLLLQELGFNPHVPVANESTPSYSATEDYPFPELLTHEGSSSGSYLQTIIHDVQRSHPNPTRITTREIRGSTDNIEYLIQDTVTGQVIFKGAKVYGFRNLQNLVRKVAKETGIGRSGRGAGAGKLSAAVAARRRKAKAAATAATSATTSVEGTDAESIASLSLVSGEDKKLDFVEVMACPGGCVNGGGQMKPTVPTLSAPEAMEVDEEGYQRPLPDDGVAATVNRTSNGVGTGTVAGMEEGMRWSTKEWVAKVEDIYWTGLPTPPSSPPLTASNVDGFAPQVKINGTMNGHVNNGIIRNLQSDQLAEEIVHEMCGDDASKRWEFMRTRFRKVESDVLSSGGVTHEAVVW